MTAAAAYVCIALCVPVANMGFAELGAGVALVAILLASAFWPSRSA